VPDRLKEELAAPKPHQFRKERKMKDKELRSIADKMFMRLCNDDMIVANDIRSVRRASVKPRRHIAKELVEYFPTRIVADVMNRSYSGIKRMV